MVVLATAEYTPFIIFPSETDVSLDVAEAQQDKNSSNEGTASEGAGDES